MPSCLPEPTHCYGLTHPAKFIWPFSILIMATGFASPSNVPATDPHRIAMRPEAQ
jgi:hypothetical protein